MGNNLPLSRFLPVETMSNSHHKALLQVYRFGDSSAGDHFVDALKAAENDPELQQFIDRERVLDAAIRQKFRKILPPADLRQKILDQQRTAKPTRAGKVIPFQFANAWIGLAAVIALMAIGILALQFNSQPGQISPEIAAATEPLEVPQSAFMANETRAMENMPEQILFIRDNSVLSRQPEFYNNDFNELVKYVREHGAPTPVYLPSGFLEKSGYGCNAVKVKDVQVGMIFFRIGDHDYKLYTIEQARLPRCRERRLPSFHRMGDEIFATWTCNGQIHIIRTKAPEKNVKQLLDI